MTYTLRSMSNALWQKHRLSRDEVSQKVWLTFATFGARCCCWLLFVWPMHPDWQLCQM